MASGSERLRGHGLVDRGSRWCGAAAVFDSSVGFAIADILVSLNPISQSAGEKSEHLFLLFCHIEKRNDTTKFSH